MKLVLLLCTIGVLSLGIGISHAQNSTLNKTGEITISKTASGNTIISNSSSFVGGFTTTYMITGNATDIKNSKDLILETITNDFTNSSTVGYVNLSDEGSKTSEQQIANPFASIEQITQKIHEALNNSMKGNSETAIVSITCNFGSSLNHFTCSAIPISK